MLAGMEPGSAYLGELACCPDCSCSLPHSPLVWFQGRAISVPGRSWLGPAMRRGTGVALGGAHELSHFSSRQTA